MKTDFSQDDRFLREAEVAHITGLSRTTRWRLERRGEFPRRRSISCNASSGIRPMATHLANTYKKKLGFKFETIRQILSGTYSASIRLSIPGL